MQRKSGGTLYPAVRKNANDLDFMIIKDDVPHYGVDRMRELAALPPDSLFEIMDGIGLKAEKRGLTPEILEALLHAD